MEEEEEAKAIKKCLRRKTARFFFSEINFRKKKEKKEIDIVQLKDCRHCFESVRIMCSNYRKRKTKRKPLMRRIPEANLS